MVIEIEFLAGTKQDQHNVDPYTGAVWDAMVLAICDSARLVVKQVSCEQNGQKVAYDLPNIQDGLELSLDDEDKLYISASMKVAGYITHYAPDAIAKYAKKMWVDMDDTKRRDLFNRVMFVAGENILEKSCAHPAHNL